MDKIEVLAHIEAPSGFKDDTSYRAQAIAAAEFEACSKLKIYGIEEHLEQSVGETVPSCVHPVDSTFDISSSFSAWYGTDLAQETPAEKGMTDQAKQNLGHSRQGTLLRKPSAAGQYAKDSVRSAPCSVTKEPASGHEPTNQVPALNAKAAVSTVHAAQTPEVVRPKTAPAGSIAAKPTILRKRTRSECSSFESLRSVIPDSQETRESVASQDPACAVVDLTTPSSYAADRLAQAVAHEQPIKHHLRPVKRRQTDQAVNPSDQSETPNLALLLGKANPILSSRQQTCGVAEDSNERVTTSSDSTSISPMKPPNNVGHPSPEQGPSPRIDASDSHSITAPQAHVDSLNSCPSSNKLFAPPTKRSLVHNASSLPFLSISSLPTAIHAPGPPVGHSRYTTHLTTSLRTLATRLPLATFFRPLVVKRDINVLERGYWHLQIPVVQNPPSQRDATASGNAGKRHFGKSSARASRGKPWTEESFLQFWHAFASYVQSGWSGWGVSIYREDPGCPHFPPLPVPLDTGTGEDSTAEEKKEITLKVTCWGEILGHLYLIMWVLSDKRTQGLAMEWRNASDDAVVEMGRGRRGAGPGQYGFKGGDGADGKWGLI